MVGNLRQRFGAVATKAIYDINTSLEAAIKRERPDLKDKIFYSPEYGGQAHTFIVGDEVFKGPKFSGQIPSFIGEYKTLLELQGKGLPVPEVTCVGESSEFYGMRRIAGVAASEVYPSLMNEEDENRFAKDIAGFVASMHQALTRPVDETVVLRRNKEMWLMLQESLALERVRQVLGSDLGFCRETLVDYLYRRNDCSRAIHAHMDLHLSNIIVNPVTKKINGIIDFGYQADCPPEEAFSQIRRTFRAGFAEKVWQEFTQIHKAADTRDFACLAFWESLVHVGRFENIRQSLFESIPQYLADILKADLGKLKSSTQSSVSRAPSDNHSPA